VGASGVAPGKVKEGGTHQNGAALVKGAAAVFMVMRRLRWSSLAVVGSCDRKGARGVREQLPSEGRASTEGPHYGERKTAVTASIRQLWR
jgi:hypothetical protein